MEEKSLNDPNATFEHQVETRTHDLDRAWRLSQELLVVALPDGSIESVNPMWAKVLGYEPSDIVGRPFVEFTHPDDLDATITTFAGIFEAPLVVPYEYRFRHRDGSYRWIGWTGAFEDGKVYASGRDMTAEKAQAEALKKAEDALREAQTTKAVRDSEAYWRNLFERLDEGFMVVEVVRDAAGVARTWRFLELNAAWERISGLSQADASGRNVDEVFPGIEREWVDAYIRVAETGEATTFRMSLAALNHVYEVRAFRVATDRVGIFFQEVSEQERQSERRAALLQLGDRLRNLDDTTNMAEAAAEIVGRTLRANAAGYGRIDASDERLIIERDWSATPDCSVVGEYSMRDYGSYIDDLLENRTVAIADGRTDPRTIAQQAGLEAIGIRALINAPVVEQGRLSALFFVLSGHVRRWTAEEIDFVQHAAERTRVAIERRRAENELQRFASTLQDQVVDRTRERDRVWQLNRDLLGIADDRGIWLSVNPAWSEVLGWSPDAIVGRTSEWLEQTDDRIKTREEVARLAEGRTTLSFENRFRDKSGEYHDLEWSAVPDQGLLYCVARDVTEQKRRDAALLKAEDALRQSQKMEAVGQLTGGLAHDFNNLLAGISGSLELMQTRMQQGRLADVDRYMTAAQGAAKRAAALTHRLLAFSRRQTLDPRPTDVNRLIGGMHELIQRTVGPGIPVEVVGASNVWPTLVDPSQLENALLNLCINARDAMPDGGRIVVETANKWLDERAARQQDMPEGQYLTLSVTDTGTGMPPEVIARVFEPFFTTKPIGEGTGLGLSMIYGFAQQSGGQVRIYSEVGQGTTVSIYLPRHYGEVADETDGAGKVAPPRAEQGETVLVVDDESTVRMLVTDILEDLGCTAIEAGDSAAGLKVLQSDVRIDLLVTDLGLPGGMNGRQMADAARVSRPDLKVLFITGYAENAILGNGHLAPGMAVLTKPFAIETMAARIRSMIEGGKERVRGA